MLRNYNNAQNKIMTDSQKKISREAPLQKCEFLWLAKLMINLSILYHLFSQISSCTTDIRLEDFTQSSPYEHKHYQFMCKKVKSHTKY